jgi:UDP-N-acetylmuramate dehydrogenase
VSTRGKGGSGSGRKSGAGGKAPAPAGRGAKPPAKKQAAPKPAAPPAGEAASRRAARPRGAASGPQFPAGLPGILKHNEPLSRHTTFRIGGPARWHFQPAHDEAVAAALAWARSEGVPWLVLGLGSNVLIRDGGFPGLVVKIGKGLDQLAQKGDSWTAGAGLPTPLLARRTGDAGAAGLQRLVGVPGSVGGGVFMNAGCHGQEFSAVLVSARVLNPAGEVVDLPRSRIPFRYRASGLEGNVVLRATVKLERANPASLKVDYQVCLKKRREGTPFDQPCCGSVFKNPEGTTAGRMIDKCGLKGRRVGAARISEQHANYIVNTGGARADDVLKLIDIARTAVFKEFGAELALEVKVIGDAA